jgi:hypothetical protein
LLYLDNLFTGERKAVVFGLRVDGDPADAIRFGVGKRIDDDRVNDAEYRDSRTDAESERETCRQCEVRMLSELTDLSEDPERVRSLECHSTSIAS